MKKNICTLVLIFCFVMPLHAEKTEELLKMRTEELFELSLEQLLGREISSAGKMAEKVGEIPASVHIVTREDIETFGYRTVAEVIRNIPGFYTIYNYSEDIVGVRGILNSNNMMILVNGTVQHSTEISQIMMPVEAIDRIEVVLGPMSVIYGSGAFLGSINIVTNEIPYSAPLNMVSASYGSADTYHGFARASGEKKEFRYTLNASLYGTDGIEERYQDMMSPEQYQKIHPQAHKRTDGDLERKNGNLNFSSAYKGVYADFQYNETENGIFEGEPAFNEGSKEESQTATARIGWQSDLTEIFHTDIKMTYSYSELHRESDNYPPDDYGYGSLYADDGKEQRFETELDLVWKPADGFNMIFGIFYKKVFDTSYEAYFPKSLEYQFSPEIITGGYDISDRDTHATFAQINYRPFDCLKITAGARLEQYKKFDTDIHIEYGQNPVIIPRKTVYNEDEKIYFIPRVAAVYSLSDHHIFKLMYGQANKPFTAEEADLADIERGLNTDLEPEEIETMEFNYLFSYPDFSFSLSLFRNDIQNLRTFSFQETEDEEGESVFIPILDNSGRMETYGTEVILTARPAKYLEMELSGAYQHTEDRTVKNRKIAYSPHLLMKAKLAYQKGGFTAGLSALYVDEMDPNQPDIMTKDNRKQQSGQTADDCFISDLNLRYDHEKTGLFTVLKISNIFDKEVRYPHSNLQNGLIDEGRSFLATVGWKF
ncbi:MAG: TonB-dependent receptor plug domain-containing protein [Desulfococcaceae bacterium]